MLLNLISLFNKKYSLSSKIEKSLIKLEVKTTICLQFQVQFPEYDNQPKIKEIFGSEWTHEIEILKSAKAYLKVFVTKPIYAPESYVTLCILETDNTIIKQGISKLKKIL